ncbi:MAG: phosphodiester glycosidase family protein [Candidatus Abawacabacteria bacterium]|nr:phosphodiester glycosidase family protein [Candidatus Abawacabacteria bacterium]
MRKFYSAILVILLFSVVVPYVEAREIVAGVSYETRSIPRSQGAAVLRAVIADTRNTRVRVEGKGSAQVCNQKFSPPELVTLAGQNDFIAAVNAQFFNSQGKAIGDYIGNSIQYGANWPSMRESANFVAIDHNGDIVTGTENLTPAAASRYSMFINGIFKINRNGSLQDITPEQVTTSFDSAYSSDRGNARGTIARTYLGINPTQHKIILLTGGEGTFRNSNPLDKGVTPQEGVDFLKSLGATDGYIMDSGGSTMMRQSARFFTPDESFATDGRSLGNLLVVRSGRPQSEQETAALPVKQCRDDAPQPGPTGTQPNQAGTSATGAGGTSAGGTVQQGQLFVPPQTVPLEVPIGGVTMIGGNENFILTYSRVLFGFAAGLVGLLALIMIIVSGFQIIIGGADEITKAKERIVGSILGLVLLSTGGFILYVVNPCFFGFGANSACTPRAINGHEYQAPISSIFSGNVGDGGATSSQPGQPHRPRTPIQYAQEKIGEANSRWQSYSADFTRMTNQLFVGAAPEAFLGFASNGGITELTPGGSFQAMGMFGVPTNTGSPAPIAGGRDRWFPLASDPAVVQFLGRPASTEPDAWKTAVPDQIAVGYAHLRDEGDSVMAALPASIRTTNRGSPWFIAMAFMGWSSGSGTAARIVSPFAGQLAGVNDNEKWGRFVQLMADAGINGTIRPQTNTSGRFDSHSPGDSPVNRYDTHDNPFYSVVRTMQKLEAGMLLAQQHGGNTAFFAYPANVNRINVQQTITNLGYWGTATR